MNLTLFNALTDETHKGNKHDESLTIETYHNVVKLLQTTIWSQMPK